MKLSYFVIISMTLYLSCNVASAQLLNKIKQRVENKTVDIIDDAIDDAVKGKKNDSGSSTPSSEPTSSSEGSARNRGGGGLVTTPPDVNQNLADAESAFGSTKYGEARYAIQQAMLGVEMEIGEQILSSLPSEVMGLQKDESEDQVTSTGWGWVGLTIMRRYTGGDEQQLTVTIANNSAWLAAANMYLSNGGYSQTTGGEQQWKQTKIQDYRAIIEYDDYSGYKLSVPMGQSSIVVFEGVNFETEQQMMDAANEVDLNDIKAKLGEQ